MSTISPLSNSIDTDSTEETKSSPVPSHTSDEGYAEAIAATKREIESLKVKLRNTKEELADAFCIFIFLV